MRVRSALAWRWGSQVLAQIITWCSTIIVVRLLDPSDYGLFAMSQVVLTALNFLNGYSFATSLIQADHVDNRRIGQVFAMLLVLNGALAVLQIALAPVAAAYYGEPEVATILRVQALIFLTTPFIALPTALLSRRIEFRSQGLVNLLCAALGAAVALMLAWFGFGVWALVYAPIAMFATRAVGLTISARLLVRPVFDMRGARDLITFGGALTLCQLFWIVQSQSDIFIAGRTYSTDDLGFYSNALFLALIVTGRFLPPINEVAFPAYAELHKAGKPLAPYFLRTVQTVLLVTAPIYVGLALTADKAVLLLFGSKWTEMIPVLTGLSLVMPAFALQIICSPATNAIGRPKVYLTTSIAGAIVMPAAFLAGVAHGPMGLVHAWWAGMPLLLLFTLAMTLPAIQVAPLALAKAVAPIAIACGLMVWGVIGIRGYIAHWPDSMQLALLAICGATTYGAALWAGWPEIVKQAWAMIQRRKPSATMPGDHTTTNMGARGA